MAHFDIPLDLPHAGRLADRIVALLEKHTEELGMDAPEVMDLADRLSSYLFRNGGGEDNPSNAIEVRPGGDVGPPAGRRHGSRRISGDRLGQFIVISSNVSNWKRRRGNLSPRR
jgi:hypothetical protein